jgi:hypothetical protein
VLQFNDKLDNPLIKISYKTYLNKYNRTIILEFNIDYISPEFNGEYIYVTEDDIGMQVFLHNLYDENFVFFELYREFTNTSAVYECIGEFMDIIKEATIQYNKEILGTYSSKNNKYRNVKN